MNTKEVAKLRTQKSDKVKVKITLQTFGFLHLKSSISGSCSTVSAVSLPHQLQGKVGAQLSNSSLELFSISSPVSMWLHTLQTHPAQLCSDDDRTICFLMDI